MSATSRERQRRYRERQKSGLRVVQLVVDEVALSVVLESFHFLNPLEEHNDEAVQRALGNMIRVLSRGLAGDA